MCLTLYSSRQPKRHAPRILAYTASFGLVCGMVFVGWVGHIAGAACNEAFELIGRRIVARHHYDGRDFVAFAANALSGLKTHPAPACHVQKDQVVLLAYCISQRLLPAAGVVYFTNLG